MNQGIAPNTKLLSSNRCHSLIEQGSDQGIRGDIDYLVIVREPVELRSRASRVRAHSLEQEPVSDIEDRRKNAFLGDHVDPIAGGTPQ